MDRRDFLRCSGYSMALPFLGSFNGNEKRLFAEFKSGKTQKARRLVCIGYQLGLYKKAFFGNVEDPFLLKPLDAAGLSKDFTTFSGLDHQGSLVKGHELVHTLLTGVERPSISFDQLAAKHIGRDTRYETMSLCAGQFLSSPSLSFTETGLPIPTIISPSVLYAKVFGHGAANLKEQLYLTHSGKSLLDKFVRNAKRLKGDLSKGDQHKLEEYFASVRGVEKKLVRQQQWLDKPFPKKDPHFKLPQFENLSTSMLLPNEELMADLIVLAIKNDSSRVITMTVPSISSSVYLGDKLGKSYHRLTHQKHHEESSDLITVEKHHMACLARILKALKETPEADGSRMLDQTILLAGSAMGNPANHQRRNFPLLVGGGGFKHQRHIACHSKDVKNRMACDLFVTLLHRLGIETDQFGSSQNNLDGVFA